MKSIKNEFESALKNKTMVSFLDELKWKKIGVFGGRRLIHSGSKGSLCLNDIIKILLNQKKYDSKELLQVINKIRDLDAEGNGLLASCDPMQIFFTSLRQRLGNYKFDRIYELDYLSRVAVQQEHAKLQKAIPSSVTDVSHAVSQTEKTEIIDVKTIKELRDYCQPNAFLHQTSSSLFALLPCTEQKMVSVWDLLKRKMAPLGDLIFWGDLDFPLTEGKSSFEKWLVKNDSLSVARASGQKKRDINKSSAEKLFQGLQSALDAYFLTKALVYATLVKQKGMALFNDTAEKESFKDYFFEVKRNFNNQYLLPFFYASCVRPKSVDDTTTSYYLFGKILNFLNDKKINLIDFTKENDALNNENMEKLDVFLESEGFQLLDQLFTVENKMEHDNFLVAYHDIFITIESLKGLGLVALTEPKQFLESMKSDKISTEYHSFLEKANQHFDLLEEILFGDSQAPMQFNEEQQKYMDNPYPIILISNQKDVFDSPTDPFIVEMDLGEDENLTIKHSLQLGKEIQWIATVSHKIQDVEAYLKKYNIEGVKVISIETLKSLKTQA